MQMTCKASYLNRDARPGVKDPNKTLYPILFMQGTDTLQIYATEQIYLNLQDVPPLTEMSLTMDYNPQYRSLRLLDVQPVKK